MRPELVRTKEGQLRTIEVRSGFQLISNLQQLLEERQLVHETSCLRRVLKMLSHWYSSPS